MQRRQRNSAPYMAHIDCVLPAILGQMDSDPHSPTFGVADRLYWAWKLSDYPNATFQGAANGLARLYAAGKLDADVARTVPWRVASLAEGVGVLLRSDGSLEEAFPHEGSYCVSALVGYDILSAMEVLGEALPAEGRERCLDTASRIVDFLSRSRERHGFITNHLATAAACFYKFSALGGGDHWAQGDAIIERILDAQSPEGWYLEYEGADPGYQTLALHYLADAHRLRPDRALWESMERGVRFVWYFAHPDGSFGGWYGSRNTRFYYPGGIRLLADEVPEAAALHAFMSRYVESMACVGLAGMDAPNMIPMFNSYCWAVQQEAGRNASFGHNRPVLPCNDGCSWMKHFPQAGLVVRSSSESYSVVSTSKGGVIAHFDRASRAMQWDTGIVVRADDGRKCSSQAFQKPLALNVEDDCIYVEASLTPMKRILPGPWKFIALRLASLTVLRFAGLRDLLKRALVWLLITGKGKSHGKMARMIRWDDEGKLLIEDIVTGFDGAQLEAQSGVVFSHIHMASSGYWQHGDHGPPP